MNLKESARMNRLETENKNLREQLEKTAGHYREQLYEIVELKTRLQLIEQAMEYGK
jgi:hypothetical protein